jgi:TonB family protein
LLKLLALTPIVGMTLALNAETVNDYVMEQPQNQTKAKVVKKGNQDAKVKVGAKTVEVKAAKPAQTKAPAKKAEPKPVVKDVKVVKTDAQPQNEEQMVFDVVEHMPQFPGGDAAIWEFVKNTVKYPEEAEKAGKQGRVVATFVVNTDGSISDAKVVRSVSEELDAEALRVINAMPKWTPGKQNGKDVRVKFTLPVTFKLNKPVEKK